jgi:hypothetical protein
MHRQSVGRIFRQGYALIRNIFMNMKLKFPMKLDQYWCVHVTLVDFFPNMLAFCYNGNGSHNESKILDETSVVLCHVIENQTVIKCFWGRHVDNSKKFLQI